MTFNTEELSEALANSNSTDQDILSQSQDYILAVKREPEGILLLLQVILETEHEEIRRAAITNILTITSKNWKNIPEEIQVQALELICQIIQMDLPHYELSMMADSCSDIFKAMGFWNELIKIICISFSEKNFYFATLFVSKIFPVASDEAVSHILQAFQNIALAGLQTDDQETCMNSLKTLVQIGKKINDVSVIEPAFGYLLNELTNSPQYQHEIDFTSRWHFVREILSIENVDENIITSFFDIARTFIPEDSISADRRRIIIYEFEPVIPIIPADMLIFMLSSFFELMIIYILEESIFPDESFAILDESLLKRSADVTDFVKGKFTEYLSMSQDESQENRVPNLALSLFILRSLLENSPESISDDVEVIKSVLQLSLSSDNELIQVGALKTIDILDIQFTESSISDISVPLMQQVSNLLFSTSSDISNCATEAFLTLCEICDTEVDGLFDHIWSLKKNDQIQRESLSDFLLILAKIIYISKDIPDNSQEEVVKFIEEILSSNDEENGDELFTEKAVSLNVLSVLFGKNSSLMPEILPKIDQILTNILNCDDDNAVCQGLSFLANLANTFRDQVTDFIKNYYDLIARIFGNRLDFKKSYLASMNTASYIIKYCGDFTLVQPMVNEIILLIYDTDKNTLTQVCSFIATMSKSFAELQASFIKSKSEGENDGVDVVETIFEALAEIIKNKDDNELLCNSFEAISKLYKRCRQNDNEFYDQKVEFLINSIFGGQIKLLNGQPENLFLLQFEIASYLLNFVDVYLRVTPPNAKDVFEFLINWLKNAKEDVASHIIVVFTESLNKSDIDEQILVPVIEYLNSIVANANSVRLRHNISYFLSSFLAKYNDQYSMVFGFLPFLDKWWDEGKKKEFGYQTCLSNIAVLYLRLFVCGAPVPNETVAKAISAYPPADNTETENMSTLILEIFVSHQEDNELIQSIIENTTFAIADLLTQPQTGNNMIKISPETLEHIQQLFRTILADNENARNQLIQHYQMNSEKQNMISQYF